MGAPLRGAISKGNLLEIKTPMNGIVSILYLSLRNAYAFFESLCMLKILFYCDQIVTKIN